MSSSAPTLTVRVACKAVEATDICSFELVAAEDSAPLPAFSAGSHVDVHLPGGLTRQYSLCNDPHETHRYLIAVLRDPASRGGSQAMHAEVQEGQLLQISAPKNHFGLAHDARRSLLLAGGIGVTPILCMAERLAMVGADFAMHYSSRTRARTAFVERIAASPFAPQVHFHFDDGDAAQKLDLAGLLKDPQAGAHLYVCGPKGYMDAVLTTARASGWPESQLHYEFFAAEVAKSETDASFEVQLASSGRVITVTKDQTVTQALSAAGVEVQTACEQGVCGTCLTRVLSGVPDHKDVYLTPEEQAANDQFTPCCSRAKTARLVLDL
ncbi:oxidoreductase [Rhodoferax sp. AJA081-3]|uniref:PDR/VanB family oxidoreductase n=1 Tax=Rhodoferax sp. AJA081-3 TaxID=2752316 RepID=UPI001AE0AF04|nr:PDR/VanB family oxidoreductase [Rhodoferax sp. AJA081-3]QTN27094.1 oxidoreductase [Rhodoferax sp. AJA081-3]